MRQHIQFPQPKCCFCFLGTAGTCFHSNWTWHDHSNAEAVLIWASRQSASTQSNPSQQTQPFISWQQPPRLIPWQSDASQQRLPAVRRDFPVEACPLVWDRKGLPSIIHLCLLVQHPDFRGAVIFQSWSGVCYTAEQRWDYWLHLSSSLPHQGGGRWVQGSWPPLVPLCWSPGASQPPVSFSVGPAALLWLRGSAEWRRRLHRLQNWWVDHTGWTSLCVC